MSKPRSSSNVHDPRSPITHQIRITPHLGTRTSRPFGGSHPSAWPVGSRIEFVAHFLGRQLAYTYEVKELTPTVHFVMSTTEGPFPMETSYSWQDTPSGGTRMTLRNRGTPSGFSGLAAPLVAAAMRRANRKDLTRLKAILESSPDRRTPPEQITAPGELRP